MIIPFMLDKHLVFTEEHRKKKFEDKPNGITESNTGDFPQSNLCVCGMVVLIGFLKAS